MGNLTTHWRPAPRIATKALAVIWRGDALLVCAVPDDTGAIKGWRPLGGSVEFGETARQTVQREMHEEIQAIAAAGKLIGVVENIFTHEGHRGHEVMFVYETTLTDAGIAQAGEFVVIDEGTRFASAWVAVSRFQSGEEVLFPDGLLALL